MKIRIIILTSLLLLFSITLLLADNTREIIIDGECILIDNEKIKSGSMVTPDAPLKKSFIICNSTGIELTLIRPVGKNIRVMKDKCFEVRSQNILREIYSCLIRQKCEGELTETDQFKKEKIFRCEILSK